MILQIAGVGVVCVAVTVFLFNRSKAALQPKPVGSKLAAIVAKLNADYPEGVSESSIAARGAVIGRYLDNDIHDTLTLTNGWTFEWFDVANYNSSGALVVPKQPKSMFILIDDLIYKLIHNEQSDLPQAV